MRIPDADVVSAWLATKRPSSQRVYEPVVAEFQAFLGKSLADASRADVTAWRASWAAEVKPATEARKLRTLRSLYRFGQEYADWPANPLLTIADPPIDDPLKTRIPRPDEVWALMTAAEQHGPFSAALVSFVFGTGCRISEVVATTWGAIIPGRTQWAWHVPHRTPAQILPLRPEVVTALQRWRVAQGLHPTHWAREDTTPLFPNAVGEPMRPVALTATIRRLARKAHLKAYPAFALRHAHAELALTHGASLRLLQRTLGHHRLSSTARYLRPDVHIPAATSDFLPWKGPQDPSASGSGPP